MKTNDLGDYLKKRSAELGLERAGQLADIQKYLDGKYPGQCRAVSLNDGVLKITTQNASLASELRFGQMEITSKFGLEQINIKIT